MKSRCFSLSEFWSQTFMKKFSTLMQHHVNIASTLMWHCFHILWVSGLFSTSKAQKLIAVLKCKCKIMSVLLLTMLCSCPLCDTRTNGMTQARFQFCFMADSFVKKFLSLSSVKLYPNRKEYGPLVAFKAPVNSFSEVWQFVSPLDISRKIYQVCLS